MTSIILSSNKSPGFVREYAAKVLESGIYSAFMAVISCRKVEEGLTQKTLADLLGKDETGVSKIVSAPRNWTTKTIAELSVALGVRFEFQLVDERKIPRVFTSSGAYTNFFYIHGHCDVTPLQFGAAFMVAPAGTAMTMTYYAGGLNPQFTGSTGAVLGSGVNFNSGISENRYSNIRDAIYSSGVQTYVAG